MKTLDRSREPKKLSRKALEASRKGTLGRFPPPQLYEDEESTARNASPRKPDGAKKTK
jgi:hypothetical protein